ncbi:hypothetical protein MPER_12051 [Moniliophthora perniciosa FA553]|nr:hypothetical protein MPER_12051 [Moniliophthora perniciosa FA553]
MSSDEEGTSNSVQKQQRKVQRACDICRRKKMEVVTDFQAMVHKRRGNDVQTAITTTMTAHTSKRQSSSQKRAPPKAPVSYIEGLEIKVEQMEQTLRQVIPDDDVRKQLGPFFVNQKWPASNRDISEAPVPRIRSIPHADLAVDAIRKWDSGPAENKQKNKGQDEEDESLALSDSLRQLVISPDYSRFYGKSSILMLIQTTKDLKEEYTKDGHTKEAIKFGPFFPNLRRPGFWQPQPVRRP